MKIQHSGEKAREPRTGLPLQGNGNKNSYMHATIEIVALREDTIRTSTEIEWKSSWDTVNGELPQTQLP